MTDNTFTSSPKQKLGNMNKKTNYSLRCINCGSKEEINLVAHRNKEEYICGFIAVCSDCSRLLDKCEKNIQIVVK
ncbi:hypothetical protein KAX02_00580 [candidate division WOR-3 bacterium]|nr:hypothetical protein [candidate division WOR-3 bacterium]